MLKLQTSNNELRHHGVKGMKWGVRRTPAQLGHPTATKKRKTKADKSRIEKAYVNYKKKKAEKKKEEEKTAYKRKTAKEMTDEELVKAINRARLEDQYRAMRPEPVSKGKKIADTMMNKVIGPAATEAGKRALTNAMNKFGDNLLKDAADPITSEINNLRRQSELLGLRNEVQNLRSGMPPVRTWGDMSIRRTLGLDDDNNSNTDNNSNSTNTTSDNSNNTNSSSSNNRRNSNENIPRAEGEVIDDRGFDVEAATRAFNEWRRNRHSQNRQNSDNDSDNVVDMDSPVTALSTEVISVGRRYADDLDLNEYREFRSR